MALLWMHIALPEHLQIVPLDVLVIVFLLVLEECSVIDFEVGFDAGGAPFLDDLLP